MTTYKEEALVSLVEEHATHELWATFMVNNEWYTVALGSNADDRGEMNRNRTVNQLHQAKKKECFDSAVSDVDVDAYLQV